MHTWNIKGNLFVFDQPKVMGIINITPNSFYDGGSINTEKELLKKVEQQLLEGADIIDVGGESTKPNAPKVNINEELNRVIPAVTTIAKYFPKVIISLDTQYAAVAEQALMHGAHLINDVSAGNSDPNMMHTVAKHKCPYIIMHMLGSPQTMQNNPTYTNVVIETYTFLDKKIKEAKNAGVIDLAVDVGFGFGKTLEHNYELLNNLNYFLNLNHPILAGLSRKSMLYNLIKATPNEALNATTAANTLALTKGAQILRVHDVLQAKEAIKIFLHMQSNAISTK